MSVVIWLAVTSVPACVAVIAYLLGYDNGYLRARRELRETQAQRARRVPPILGATRRVKRDDGEADKV